MAARQPLEDATAAGLRRRSGFRQRRDRGEDADVTAADFRTGLAVLILGDEPTGLAATRAQVESLADLPASCFVGDLEHAESSAHAVRPSLALVLLPATPARGLEAIATLARTVPSATVVALAGDPGAATALAALRAGAAECLRLPAERAALAALVRKAAAIHRLARPPGAPAGELWTVVAPKEGVGATTLVANLGLELRTAGGRDVVLVDLDLRCADLALVLNVDPSPALLDLARGRARLDPVFVHGSLARHPSGLLLLAATAPLAAERAAAPTGAEMRAVLDVLRASHELVIVDAPPPLSEPVRAAVACSDRVIVPTEITVACLRAAWRTLEALAVHDLRPPRLDVVAARYAGDRAGITLAEAADALRVPVVHALPQDDDVACRALNGGLPLAAVAADAPLTRAIAALARTLGTQECAVSPHRKMGLLGRIFAS
jgi:pilus assembly protein CpaE